MDASMADWMDGKVLTTVDVMVVTRVVEWVVD